MTIHTPARSTAHFTAPIATRACALITALVAAATLAGCATTAAPAGATYSFGLWGDMPYKKAGDDPKLPAVLASINRADIEFSLYDGDIKDGSSQCTDDIYTDALSMFGSMKKPVVYIPRRQRVDRLPPQQQWRL
jgi:hypothetical protein